MGLSAPSSNAPNTPAGTVGQLPAELFSMIGGLIGQPQMGDQVQQALNGQSPQQGMPSQQSPGQAPITSQNSSLGNGGIGSNNISSLLSALLGGGRGVF